MSEKKNSFIPVFILLLAALFYFPFLGSIHLFDWDEINFAESAREMILSENYGRVQINFQPFWEKPPLFFWFQVVSMKIFGIGEYAARFPNAICGVISLILIFHLGKKYYDERFGILWSLSFFGSVLPAFYFKSGIIDPYYNLFIFVCIYFLFKANSEPEKKSNFLIAGIWIGLAVLTKGPVAVLITTLCLIVYYAFRKFKDIPFLHLFYFYSVGGLVSLLWFGVETWNNGFWFLKEFIDYHISLLSTSNAGHGQPFYYHPIVLLIGCFPASIFALPALNFFSNKRTELHELKKWMGILFFVVLILFSIVETKILHYSSLCYFPLTFFSAYVLHRYLENAKNYGVFYKILILLFGFAYSLFIVLLPAISTDKSLLSRFMQDEFVKSAFSRPVEWSGFEILIGVYYFIVIMIAIYFLLKNKLVISSATLFVGTSILLQMLLLFVFPKIEKYTQSGPVSFYESIREEDCYVEVLGFKSYAHLFYSNKKPYTNQNSRNKQWLLFGEIDKPAYFVAKTGNSPELMLVKDLIVIKSEYGFSYYKRLPKK